MLHVGCEGLYNFNEMTSGPTLSVPGRQIKKDLLTSSQFGLEVDGFILRADLSNFGMPLH